MENNSVNANTVVKIEDFTCWNARDADYCLALMISAIGLAGIGLAFYYSYHNLYSGHRDSFEFAIFGCSVLTCVFSVVVASSVIFSLTYFTFRHSTRLVSWFYSNIEQGHKEEQLIKSLKGSTKQDLLVAILLGRFGCFNSILPSNYLIEKCITTSKQDYFLKACEQYVDSNSWNAIFRQLSSTERCEFFLFFSDMALSRFRHDHDKWCKYANNNIVRFLPELGQFCKFYYEGGRKKDPHPGIYAYYIYQTWFVNDSSTAILPHNNEDVCSFLSIFSLMDDALFSQRVGIFNNFIELVLESKNVQNIQTLAESLWTILCSLSNTQPQKLKRLLNTHAYLLLFHWKISNLSKDTQSHVFNYIKNNANRMGFFYKWIMHVDAIERKISPTLVTENEALALSLSKQAGIPTINTNTSETPQSHLDLASEIGFFRYCIRKNGLDPEMLDRTLHCLASKIKLLDVVSDINRAGSIYEFIAHNLENDGQILMFSFLLKTLLKKPDVSDMERIDCLDFFLMLFKQHKNSIGVVDLYHIYQEFIEKIYMEKDWVKANNILPLSLFQHMQKLCKQEKMAGAQTILAPLVTRYPWMEQAIEEAEKQEATEIKLELVFCDHYDDKQVYNFFIVPAPLSWALRIPYINRVEKNKAFFKKTKQNDKIKQIRVPVVSANEAFEANVCISKYLYYGIMDKGSPAMSRLHEFIFAV